MPVKKVRFVNREISWLSFNERVLKEAADPTVPLIERLKFLGIFSNNRDEFFRVRVATLKRMQKLGKSAEEITGKDPAVLLKKIREIVNEQQVYFDGIYNEILKELEKHDVFIVNEKQLSPEQGEFVKDFFHRKVRSLLVPLMLQKKGELPFLKEKTTHLLVKLSKTGKVKSKEFAILEIPSSALSRFTVLPSTDGKTYIMLLDDVIRYCLNDIFSIFDYNKSEAYTIKLTRDAELDIDDDITKSIVEKISKSIKKRKKGAPVRLIYDREMPPDLFELLIKKLKLSKEDNLIAGGRYHNFKDFMDFPDLGKKELLYEPLPALNHPELNKNKRSLFDIIREKDILLTYPYQHFGYIIDLLREAAIDPKVVSIDITLYRVADNSNIINALINAAKNGKAVTVVLELRARFDEEANLQWADRLQEDGVKVIFGVPNLKVHSKIFLITRKEGKKTEYFAHLGTGNFNEKTAGVYSDHSLLTSDRRITMELNKLFCFFSDNLKIGAYKHLLISPFSMRKKITSLISSEIANAKAGKEAFIMLKMNNLSDLRFIEKLYEASKAGVKIKLIIRGVCSLIPGLKGLSENIEAVSIVDRFLEHSRLFIFCNGGNELYYLSSADWLVRNFDYRIETACPVYDKSIQGELREYFNMQLKGNVKARIIGGKGKNELRKKENGTPFRAQYEIYDYFKNKISN
jgi:polyphosphate kinase